MPGHGHESPTLEPVMTPCSPPFLTGRFVRILFDEPRRFGNSESATEFVSGIGWRGNERTVGASIEPVERMTGGERGFEPRGFLEWPREIVVDFSRRSPRGHGLRSRPVA